MGYTGPRGELLNLHGGSVLAFYHPGPDILNIVDVEADLGFLWKRDLSPLPYYEAGSPMRALLHGWMRKQGVQFVHGGAVGTESGGVLLAGREAPASPPAFWHASIPVFNMPATTIAWSALRIRALGSL